MHVHLYIYMYNHACTGKIMLTSCRSVLTGLIKSIHVTISPIITYKFNIPNLLEYIYNIYYTYNIIIIII